MRRADRQRLPPGGRSTRRGRIAGGVGPWLLLALAGCGGAEEASRASVPVRIAPSGMDPVETDLGYAVALTEARVALADLRFAVAGEEHAQSPARALESWLVPAAHAHPGHATGGTVTGELLGRFVGSWRPTSETPLGTATLLEGSYSSANFAFERAAVEHGLSAADPLLGHTAVLRGVATRGAAQRSFLALIDMADGQELIGVPFEAAVRQGAPIAIGFELLVRDPSEGDTLFDGIEFERLPLDSSGVVRLAPSVDSAVAAAYARLVDTFSTPDHFRMVPLAQ